MTRTAPHMRAPPRLTVTSPRPSSVHLFLLGLVVGLLALVAGLSLGGLPRGAVAAGADLPVGTVGSAAGGVPAGSALVSAAGSVPTGPYPWGLTIDPATHRAFVIDASNAPTDHVTSVDLLSKSALLTWSVGGNGEARGSWFDNSTNDLWVPYLDSNLGKFDTSNGNLLQNVQVGLSGRQAAPYSVAFDPQTNQLWVTDFFNSELSVVDRPTGHVVANVSTGAGSWPYWITLDPSTQLAFVTDTGSNTVHVVNTSTDTLVANLAVSDLTYSTEALDPIHHLVYVSGSQGSVITVIEENPLKVLTTLPTVGQVFGVALDPVHDLLATTGFSQQGEVYCASNLTAMSPLPYPVASPMQIAFDPALDLLGVTAWSSTSNGTGSLDLFDVSKAASVCSGSTPPPPPTLLVSDTATPSWGTAPLVVNFTSSASGGVAPYTYGWSFGDGTSGSSASPTHTYVNHGAYIVSLTVTDSAGTTAQASSLTVYVQGENQSLPLTLSVSLSSITGPAPLTVSIGATPSGGVSPYVVDWNFGDGTLATGLVVSHTYSEAGNFVLSVSVSDGSGGSYNAPSIQVTILGSDVNGDMGSSVVLRATASAQTGVPPLSVSFAASASGGRAPYLFVWAFGDRTSLVAETASHTYSSPGTYYAQVTVTDTAGHYVASQLLEIQVHSDASSSTATGSLGGSGPVVSVGLGSLAGLGAGFGYPLLSNRRAHGSFWRSRFDRWSKP
ncbi:MAG: PKD domain-containing protein [Euryarchaeota archaeon]|nr:PKD domain-containing protein [Euryarchaeota archaeon]MDE2046277.1 PKD domain-containing protein [Thermoplasmata archaeon]